MNGHDRHDLTAATERLRIMAQPPGSRPGTAGLDSRVRALAGVGAALALSSPSDTFRSLVGRAMAAGVTVEEMLGALVAVAPTIGAARVVANTPRFARALGYEIEAALEESENGTGLS